jgi:hypothetical protein
MNPPAADRGGTVDSLSDDNGASSATTGTADVASRLVALRASAKGWHGVQLAVLGFIGLCGVLQGAAGKDGPHWLQVLAGLLVLLALALACTATALVATAAWPVHEIEDGAAAGSDDTVLHNTARRLRTGITITFVAVVLLALGATSSWWPKGGQSSGGGPTQVEVTTSQGAVCGTLEEGEPGTITVASGGRPVAVPAADVVRLRPVTACT